VAETCANNRPLDVPKPQVSDSTIECVRAETLRGRELAKAAQEIAAEAGQEHRPVADGQRLTGIYRCSVILASGRYAMLDDSMGFSHVPWKPVIVQRLGQLMNAVV